MTENTTSPRVARHTHAREGQHLIWTAKRIGERIGRSAAYVRRTLSQMPGTPVRRHGSGNFYAEESALLAFMMEHHAA